ncbi:MAG: aminoglycoside phosphotransferase family protein [Dehalococcoidia bacterium]
MIQKLNNNITNKYGESGTLWLENLTDQMHEICKNFQLSKPKIFPDLSWNFIFTAIKENKNVVVKMGYNSKDISQEYDLLNNFSDISIKVLDYISSKNAMIMLQGEPGYSLKHFNKKNIFEKIDIYTNLVKSISKNKNSQIRSILPVDEIFKSLEVKHNEKNFIEFQRKGIHIAKFLLNDSQPKSIFHGDLHLENIILHGSKWKIIDPKGILSNIYYEVSIFDFFDNEDYHLNRINYIFKERVSRLSKNLLLDEDKLIAWVFVRMVLSICWIIEDKGNYENKLLLLKKIYSKYNFDYLK